jgi:Tol biopolymer transport system component
MSAQEPRLFGARHRASRAVILLLLALLISSSSVLVQAMPRLAASESIIYIPFFTISRPLIAFTAGFDTDIYVMDIDGLHQTPLTTDHVGNYDSAWSPDGRKIIFVSYRDGNSNLYIMNADGTQQTRLTDYPSYEFDPAWSRDGSKIAYESYKDGITDIYVMNADGTGNRPLLTGATNGQSPTWSPDGSRVAFESAKGIYVINVNGGTPIQITGNAKDKFAENPAWSPDGTKIAYSYRSSDASIADIYVVNANDGTGKKRLTFEIGAESSPAWSPDGTKIAYAFSDTLSCSDIVVINADGSGRTPLAQFPCQIYATQPAWQP